MIHDLNLTGFGAVLTISLIALILSLRGSNGATQLRHSSKTSTAQPSTSLPEKTPEQTPEEAIALRQQCAQLRHQLHQQATQLTADFQDTTFEQLQPLLINYPTAKKMAETDADLPAKNLVALFSPLGNLLETWNIQPIGTVWEQVRFDPQLHQPDVADVIEGEPLYVRFVGYRQGDRILTPARVSRTLPERG